MRVSKKEVLDSVAAAVSAVSGNQLGQRQYEMIESRLARRMIALGVDGFEAYDEYFKSNQASEINALVSLLTTHHTFFFREFHHFEFLKKELPSLVDRARKAGRKELRILSAACSRGQEVYSLAMFMSFHLKEVAPDFNFKIVGTDIDPESVLIAKNGVYKWDELKDCPNIYLSGHWARGTGDIADFARVKNSLRSHCEFGVANLLGLGANRPAEYDLIFCRNVFIYFDLEKIKSITSQLLPQLFDDGYLMIGTSESLNVRDYKNLKYSAPAVYQKSDQKPAIKKVSREPQVAVTKTLRVLCVDDSPTVLTLLKKILTKDRGFEVIGTATNGLEAQQALRNLKDIDLVTLDIHMPQMTGVEYLEKNFGPGHPPVVMVTSAPREDGGLSQRALSLGAADFVEKPTLVNLIEKGDELRTKLRVAFETQAKKAHQASSLDRDFAKTLPKAERKDATVFVFWNEADHQSLERFLSSRPIKDCRLYLVGPRRLSQTEMFRFSKSAKSQWHNEFNSPGPVFEAGVWSVEVGELVSKGLMTLDSRSTLVVRLSSAHGPKFDPTLKLFTKAQSYSEESTSVSGSMPLNSVVYHFDWFMKAA
jgi:chemotaxis protein methyltransferase CheR